MRDFINENETIQEENGGRKMKAIPLIVTDIVNNSYQCYKVMADEDMTELDVITAIKKVITEFCETETGKDTLKENSGYFTIDDFINCVPDAYCLKCGFYILSEDTPVIQVDSNEILYEDK